MYCTAQSPRLVRVRRLRPRASRSASDALPQGNLKVECSGGKLLYNGRRNWPRHGQLALPRHRHPAPGCLRRDRLHAHNSMRQRSLWLTSRHSSPLPTRIESSRELEICVAECEFCQIAAGIEPARVIHETRTTLAFFPLRPAVIGHTLLIPKAHLVDFLAVDSELASELAFETIHIGRALQRALEPDGMNVITSSGAAASQTVFHLHIHLVPRRYGDAIGNIWPPSAPSADEIEDHLAELVRREVG